MAHAREISHEWLLAWSGSANISPEMFHPLADEFANISEREKASGIPSGTPIIVGPDGSCAIGLSKFFLSPHFCRLRDSTRQSYASDIRFWVEYLDSRGKDWSQACPDDVNTFWLWRTRADLNDYAVSGSKVNRELAAISLLYRWASHPSRGHVRFNPVERESLQFDRSSRSVRSKTAVRQRVKWFTPRTFRLWRNIGVEGYTLDGLRDESFRGRMTLRNRALVELLFGSGLRITEASSLLLPELPMRGTLGSFDEAPLSAAIAKGARPRVWYLLDDALALVNSYVATTRRVSVESARRNGRYKNSDVIHVSQVKATTHEIKYKFNGRWHGHDQVGIDQRMRLFIDHGEGLEPLWLWLSESGMPMGTGSWTDVFDVANDRVEKIFRAARVSGQVARDVRHPRLSPHSLRHSFALFMLVALHRAVDDRDGSDHVADYNEVRYRTAWEMVRDLLGHSSVSTTQDCYLAPLNGVRLRTLIDGDDLKKALRGLAKFDPRVLDVEGVEP
jgi:site-specific recombinase XerD